MRKPPQQRKAGKGAKPPNQASSPTPKPTEVHPIVRGGRLVWTLVLAGSTGLAYLGLRPDISIAVFSSRNVKLPFETHFLVTNNGLFAVYDVHYTCDKLHLHIPDGAIPSYRRIGVDIRPVLSAKDSYSVYCDGHFADRYQVDYPQPDLERLLDDANLNIYVRFRPSFWPWEVEKGFGFRLTRDADQNAEWLPTGSGVRSDKELAQ